MNHDDIDSHILEKYEIVERLGKGAYGIVWKVIHKKTKIVYALKKICNAFANPTDAQRTYREIMYLQAFDGHENIVHLHKIIKAKNDKDIYILLEYVESDLHHVIRAKILQEKHIEYISYQILQAIKYMHAGEVIHRDIKPSNILVNPKCHVKLADFGLARCALIQENDSNIVPLMTEYVATRWYRAPEILVGSTHYTKATDMWAFGCVLAEMITGKVLFPGTSTLNQLEKILEFTGYPSEEDIDDLEAPLAETILNSISVSKNKGMSSYFPEIPDVTLEFLKGLLQFNPNKRLTAEGALKHKFFARLREKFQDDEPVLNRAVYLHLDDDKKFPTKDYIIELYNVIYKRKQEERKKKKRQKLGSMNSDDNENDEISSKSPSSSSQAMQSDDQPLERKITWAQYQYHKSVSSSGRTVGPFYNKQNTTGGLGKDKGQLFASGTLGPLGKHHSIFGHSMFSKGSKSLGFRK